jgi:hypothetical protein
MMLKTDMMALTYPDEIFAVACAARPAAAFRSNMGIKYDAA